MQNYARWVKTSNTPGICKTLFYHTSARYVIKSSPPHRFDKGEASCEAAIPSAQVHELNHQNCQLATSCHKSQGKMKAWDSSWPWKAAAARNCQSFNWPRHVKKYEKPAVTPWWFLVSLMRRRRAQASSSKANKLGGRDWKWAAICTLHFNIVIVRSQPSKLMHWISGPSHILRFLGNAT